MKKLNEMSTQERNEFEELLQCWLTKYVDGCVRKVMARAEEIYNDATAMKMLRNLKIEEEKERDYFNRQINMQIYELSHCEEDGKEVEEVIFNHYQDICKDATHYREVLYDLYIR